MSISILESPSERREQWQRTVKGHQNRFDEVHGSGQTSGIPKDIDSSQALRDYLQDFRVNDPSQQNPGSVLERLSTTIGALEAFASSILSVSKEASAAALIWYGFAAAFKVFATGKSVSLKRLHLMIDLGNCIPSIPEFSNQKINKLRAVQYALQDLFDDYLDFCAQVSEDFTNSKSSLGMTKTRMTRHHIKLHDAAKSEWQLLRAQEEAEIAKLTPALMLEPPKESEPAVEESTIEFPVNTVDKARNSAFVGRDDLINIMVRKMMGSTPSIQREVSSHLEVGDVSSRGSDRLTPSVSSRDVPSTKSTDSTRRPDTSPVICVLHGVGGIGKTQAVLEYYYENRDEYDGCFWMDSERDWSLARGFARIADKLNLLPQKTTGEGGHEIQNKAIEASRHWLQTTSHNWLLVFDNVEDFGDLARYLPTEKRASLASVIVTTQSPTMPAWFDNTHTIPVKPLTPETAADCLFNYLDREPIDDDERGVACQLAEHVGCLPLVMATIGGYIRQTESPLAEFFANIQRKASLWEKAPKIQDTLPYERSLIDVFDQAFKDLSEPSRELLNILAFLDPDSIPEELFTEAIKEGCFEKIKNKDDLWNCYFELRSRQLIRRDTSSKDPYISIHRTVQWNALLDLSHDKEQRWACFRKAFNIVRRMLPQTSPLDMPEPEVWPPYVRHGRQILELRTHCLWPEPPVDLPMEFARILADMGTYMWFSGKFPEGEKALDTAENILDDNNAKMNDPLRAKIYLLLGILTSFEGVSERERSMNFRKKGNLSRKEGLGGKSRRKPLSREEDILLWNAHSDMAFGFIQQEDMEQTRQYMEECLEQYETWDKDETVIPYEYAKYYQLVSHCDMADKDPLQAIRKITKCYKLMQSAAGADHPMTYLISFCHATLLWHTGTQAERAKAFEIHKNVLQHRRRILGEFSHFTLESYSTCGKLSHDNGQDEEAEQYLATCLQRRKRAVWNEEGVTRAQHRYSLALRALAKRDQDNNNEQKAFERNQQAEKLEIRVAETISKYREDYHEYLPRDVDTEKNLDQMVSFWAGRFTGCLEQGDMTMEQALAPFPVVLNIDSSTAANGGDHRSEQNGVANGHHRSKKRRLE